MTRATRRRLPFGFACMALWCAGLCIAAPAHAQNQPVTCSTTDISDMAFGAVDPLSGQAADTTATISFSCSNPNNQTYAGAVCFTILDGVVGPRSMQDGQGDTLSYQMYLDAGRTLTWGASPASSVVVPVTIPRQSSGWTASATLYGRVFGGQTSAVAGNYLAMFAGTQTAMAVNVAKNGAPSDCNGVAGTSTGQSFNATAVVARQCTVLASPLDFGTADLLGSNIDNATTITTQCTAGVSYEIGLDNGLHASGTIRRMSDGGGEFVVYELYRDSGRTQRWGNTLNNDTLSLTGTGQPQGSTVHGRVPAQPSAAAGLYSDTVTVTVTY